jgi:quinol monooxygenase YgiN
MSVIVMLHIDGDPDKLEEFASANKEKMAGIVDRAKGKGLIAHRFYGDENGLVVLDEWPDAESFQSFFEEAQGEIGPMMQEVGSTSEPRPRFLRALETHDRYGWGA